MELTAWLSSSLVGDGEVEPIEVGGTYRLALALHRTPPALAPTAATRLGWHRWEVDVAGTVAVVDQFDLGGALVLVTADDVAFVHHLAPGAPRVVVGQDLVLRATPHVDPWAWLCGPDFPDADDWTRLWRVVRVQQVAAPLVPMPGQPPGTSIADNARAVVVDVPAVERWAERDPFSVSVDHLVTLRPYDVQ